MSQFKTLKKSIRNITDEKVFFITGIFFPYSAKN